MVGFGRAKPGTRIRRGIASAREPTRPAAHRSRPTGQRRFGKAEFRAVPQPVPKQLEINAVGRCHTAGCRESLEVGQVGRVRPHGVRAESALRGEIHREVAHRSIEKHPLIVTQMPTGPRQACRALDHRRTGPAVPQPARRSLPRRMSAGTRRHRSGVRRGVRQVSPRSTGPCSVPRAPAPTRMAPRFRQQLRTPDRCRPP
jgi:hypothetical protein